MTLLRLVFQIKKFSLPFQFQFQLHQEACYLMPFNVKKDKSFPCLGLVTSRLRATLERTIKVPRKTEAGRHCLFWKKNFQRWRESSCILWVQGKARQKVIDLACWYAEKSIGIDIESTCTARVPEQSWARIKPDLMHMYYKWMGVSLVKPLYYKGVTYCRTSKGMLEISARSPDSSLWLDNQWPTFV